ncbi:MAG: ATP-binding protein [Candidatus Bathyarchaeia archaeon]|jgi:PAS domain S-box-containing protein
MNFLAWFSLLISIVCLALGIAVYFLDKKAKLNKLFLAILIFNAYWAFSNFMMYQADNAQTAYFWVKTMVVWPFFSALMLHFTLVFTESSLLNNKKIYGIMYLPASVFAVIDLTTDWISALPTKQPWGYEFAVPENMTLATIDTLWALTLATLSVIFCIIYYRRTSNLTKKHQAKFIAMGLTFPITVSIITDSILPMASITFPSLENIACCIFSAFVGYAMWRYDLFHLNPEVAAENIFTIIPDSLILARVDEKIVQVNDALTKISGFTKKEVIEKRISELFLEQKTGEDVVSQIWVKGEVKNFETQLKTRTGQKTVLFSGSLVKKKDQIIGFTCTVHDITEHKEMEKKLVTAERFASIGELAGMVGHDLRNPLSSISGATYYLKTRYADKLDDKAKDMLRAIDKSIDYSNKIINDLLDYSREVRLDLENTTPKELLASSLALVTKPQEVEIQDFSLDTPKINADKSKLNRVFVNIIKNAFDAMPNGGTLTIKNRKEGNNIAFSFTDTGTGMSKETMDKLWKPLFTTKAKGMGFGLPICKRIIEAHGGKIYVDSIQDEGTTITTVIPINQNTPTQ